MKVFSIEDIHSEEKKEIILNKEREDTHKLELLVKNCKNINITIYLNFSKYIDEVKHFHITVEKSENIKINFITEEKINIHYLSILKSKNIRLNTQPIKSIFFLYTEKISILKELYTIPILNIIFYLTNKRKKDFSFIRESKVTIVSFVDNFDLNIACSILKISYPYDSQIKKIFKNKIKNEIQINIDFPNDFIFKRFEIDFPKKNLLFLNKDFYSEILYSEQNNTEIQNSKKNYSERIKGIKTKEIYNLKDKIIAQNSVFELKQNKKRILSHFNFEKSKIILPKEIQSRNYLFFQDLKSKLIFNEEFTVNFNTANTVHPNIINAINILFNQTEIKNLKKIKFNFIDEEAMNIYKINMLNGSNQQFLNISFGKTKKFYINQFFADKIRNISEIENQIFVLKRITSVVNSIGFHFVSFNNCSFFEFKNSYGSKLEIKYPSPNLNSKVIGEMYEKIIEFNKNIKTYSLNVFFCWLIDKYNLSEDFFKKRYEILKKEKKLIYFINSIINSLKKEKKINKDNLKLELLLILEKAAMAHLKYYFDK